MQLHTQLITAKDKSKKFPFADLNLSTRILDITHVITIRICCLSACIIVSKKEVLEPVLLFHGVIQLP